MNTSTSQAVSRSQVYHLLMLGVSQSEIARTVGVSRQRISQIAREMGWTPRSRLEMEDHWPWKVPVEMGSGIIYRAMRWHGYDVLTGGLQPEGAQERQKLESFRNRLRDNDLVVEFDPNIPPNEHAKGGGFAYRNRRKSDGDLMTAVTNTRP